jgi:hypothetical protein
MPRSRYVLPVLFLACTALNTASAQDARTAAAAPPVPAQYAATAFGQSGAIAGKSFGLSVYVDAVTSDSEIQELVGILRQKGQSGLVSAMEDMKEKGRVAPTGVVGTGMRIVRMRPGKNGGLHIVMATDRPITFGELYNSTRSRDYPVGIVVLDVDKDGKGAGSLAPACKIKFNKKNELEVEHYGQKPFRLTNVYREK